MRPSGKIGVPGSGDTSATPRPSPASSLSTSVGPVSPEDDSLARRPPSPAFPEFESVTCPGLVSDAGLAASSTAISIESESTLPQVNGHRRASVTASTRSCLCGEREEPCEDVGIRDNAGGSHPGIGRHTRITATEQLTIQRVLCMACVLCRQDVEVLFPRPVAHTSTVCGTVQRNCNALFSVRRIMQSLTQASIEVITAARPV